MNPDISPQPTQPVAPEIQTPIIPTSEPTQPAISPPLSKLKWFLIAGIVIVLIFVSLGGAYVLSKNQKSLSTIIPSGNSSIGNSQNSEKNSINGNAGQATNPTPTPDPTANWKVYVNKELGIELKYPQNWKMSTNCKFGNICFLSDDFEEIANAVGEGGDSYVASKGSVFSISSSIKTSLMKLDDFCRPGGPITITSCEDTKLDGIDAKKRISGNATAIGALTDNFMIIVGQNYSVQENKKVLDQILSTFKFTQ